jgi:hypothetical protein
MFTEGQRRHLETAFRSLLASAQEAQAKLQNLATISGEPPGWTQEVAAEIDRLILQAQRAAANLELSLDRNEIPLQRELAAWASTTIPGWRGPLPERHYRRELGPYWWPERANCTGGDRSVESAVGEGRGTPRHEHSVIARKHVRGIDYPSLFRRIEAAQS